MFRPQRRENLDGRQCKSGDPGSERRRSSISFSSGKGASGFDSASRRSSQDTSGCASSYSRNASPNNESRPGNSQHENPSRDGTWRKP